MKIKTQIVGDDTLSIKLLNAPQKLNEQIERIFHRYGNEMRNFMIEGMKNTPQAPWSYKRKTVVHYPSLPGNFPAIDTGRLIAQIKYYSSKKQLEVGVMDDVPYGKFLETGTAKMQARPFIKPTFDNFEPKIKNDIMDAIRKTFNK